MQGRTDVTWQIRIFPSWYGFLPWRGRDIVIAPLNYDTLIKCLLNNYKKLFEELSRRTMSSPIDDSGLLDTRATQTYQSLIDVWIVSISRFDVNTTVMILSSFSVTPRIRRTKVIYARAMRDTTEEWLGKIWLRRDQGILPHDAPQPLGQYVTITPYVDENLIHDLTAGSGRLWSYI